MYIAGGGTTLLWFPWNVNAVNARFTGLCVVITSIFGIIFSNNDVMIWVIAGQTLDFILRFLAGGRASIAGAIATIPSSFFESEMTAGPPKQFAALCGVLFSGLATLFLFLGREDVADIELVWRIIGCVILFMLICAASLEAFCDLCVGCKFYALFQCLHIVPKRTLDVCNDDIIEKSKASEVGRAHLPDWFFKRPIDARDPFTSRRYKMPHLPSPYNIIVNCIRGSKKDRSWDTDEFDTGTEMSSTVEVSTDSKKKSKKKKGKKHSDDGSSASSSSDSDSGSYSSDDSDSGSSGSLVKNVVDVKEQSMIKKIFRDGYDRLTFTPTYTDPEVQDILQTFPVHDARVLKYKGRKGVDPLVRINNFNPIKYFRPSHYGISLGITGFAAVWKITEDVMDVSAWYYAIFGVAAALVFLVLLFINVLHAIFHTKKLYKNSLRQTTGQYFAMISINLAIFAFIVTDDSLPLSKVLIWIAAPIALISALTSVAFWFVRNHPLPNILPNWMIPPLSTLVIALVLMVVNGDDYYHVAFFFFSFGLITWLPLFVINVQRFIVSFAPDQMRISMWIWMAPPGIALPTYLALKAQICSCDPWAGDVFAYILLYTTIVFYLILLTLTVIHFFGNDKFGELWWGFVFPLATLSFALLEFHRKEQTDATEAFAVLSIIQVTWITCHFSILTIGSLMRRGFFHPVMKMGPLAVMKLIHFSFRGALKRMAVMLRRLQDDFDEDKLAQFDALFKTFAMAHEEHAKFEDEVLFPTFSNYFPGIEKQAAGEHKRDHKLLGRLIKQIRQLRSGGEDQALLQKIIKDLDEIGDLTIKHLDYEEKHLSPVGLKYMPIRLQKRVVRKMWEMMSRERWEVILPWMINSQEIHMRRVKLLRAFMTAMPYRAQQFGQILIGHVSKARWERLTRYVPEIRPKHTMLWVPSQYK